MKQLFIDLYQISNSSNVENKYIFDININSKHEIYIGHFPGQPVTPGVVQTEILKELTENILKKKLQLKSMPNCKFLAILDPTESKNIQAEIEIKEQNDKFIRTNASIKNEDKIFLKANFVYHFVD